MKRLISFCFFLTAFATLTPKAYAYDFSAVAPSGQTLYFNITSVNTVNVTCPVHGYHGYTKPSDTLIIPSIINYSGTNYTVTAIGDYAFDCCVDLSFVSIPNTVTSFNYGAFANCSTLQQITLPSNVSYIGSWCFSGSYNLTEFHVQAAIPPSLAGSAFSNSASSKTFYIPSGTLSAYQWSWGTGYTYVEVESSQLQFSLTINSNDSIWGTGSYLALGDSIAEVTATANYGYHFDHWNYGSTANPDTLLLSSDVTITAIFAKNQYTVTGTSNDDARGLVTGSATVDYLDSVTLTATPNYGFHFQRWNDYHTENPRTVAATGDINLTAAFDLNQYTITLAADTSIHGTVSGAGEYNYLSEHNISATANYGYHFAHWNDGNTDNPRTITLTQDTHFVAIFERNTYSLTANVNDVALGSVSFPDGDSALYLDTLRVVATPMAHRHVVSWTGPGITATSTNKDTVWVAMTENRAVSCTFAIDTHTVVTTVNDIARGMVTQSGTEFVYGTPCTVEATAYTGYIFVGWSNGVTETPYTFAVLEDVELTAIFLAPGEETYTITVNSNATTMGTATVNGGATATVMSGETVTLTATANEGYHFVRWDDNSTETVRTITVTEDMNFIAYFEANGDTESIRDAEAISSKIYSNYGQIIVENSNGHTVTLYDAVGRVLAIMRNKSNAVLFDAPASGTYLVKIGDAPARRIVVVR
jgi:hypothetical protein